MTNIFTARFVYDNYLRLKSELEKSALIKKEAMDTEQSRHAKEMENFNSQLNELKAQVAEYESEMITLRQRANQAKAEYFKEHQELLNEAKIAFEREKQIVMDENMRLNEDINHLIESLDQTQREKNQIEAKFKDALQRRETVTGKFIFDFLYKMLNL